MRFRQACKTHPRASLPAWLNADRDAPVAFDPNDAYKPHEPTHPARLNAFQVLPATAQATRNVLNNSLTHRCFSARNPDQG
jgi:hypothetical protein